MNFNLEIFINNKLVFGYPRNTRLPGKQREFLDAMDHDMNEGIKLNGNIINMPSTQQKLYYITLQLIQALNTDNLGMVRATCAYLINRQPTLQQIRAYEEGETISLELVYDDETKLNG